MNSKEHTFEMLKCNLPTPLTVCEYIDYYFDNEDLHGTKNREWQSMPGTDIIFGIKLMALKYFTIYVYYKTDIECTLCVIKFNESSYLTKIKENHMLDGLDNYVIYCDDMNMEQFLDEFGHVYDEFMVSCDRPEYM
jgi:hypothetical protein